MPYIRRISRLSGFAGRQFAVLFLSLGLGIPGICAALCVAFGLAAAPLIGPAAWEPAGGFIGGLSLSVTAMPGVMGVSVLLLMAVLLPAAACFGRWCLSQAAARPAAWRWLPWLRRLVALACSLRVPAGIAPNPGFVWHAGAANCHSPKRTLASTSAGLSGAAPLLE